MEIKEFPWKGKDQGNCPLVCLLVKQHEILSHDRGCSGLDLLETKALKTYLPTWEEQKSSFVIWV